MDREDRLLNRAAREGKILVIKFRRDASLVAAAVSAALEELGFTELAETVTDTISISQEQE